MHLWINIFSICILFSITSSKPIDGDLLDSTDSELVGSNLNKVYAPAPFEDLQSEGTKHKNHQGKGHHSDDDDSGYYTSKSTKGDNGYKHFDSYHKKGGDKYGYEAHSAYGTAKGGKDGGSHHSSGKYEEVDGDDGGSHAEYHDGEGTEVRYGKLKRKEKEPKSAATDGDYYYSNYESEGEGDDSGHYEGEGGDEGHYEDEGGHYSEGSSEGDEGASAGYYDGEGESESYYDGEGETRQTGVIHHGGPSGGATSYSVRHF